MTEEYKPPITSPPPHLLKKFSAQAQDETKKRNGAGYLKTFATLCIEWAMNSKSTSNDRQIRNSGIEPSNELVGEWLCDDGAPWDSSEQVTITITTNRLRNVATQAARWGADQELEACCEWVSNYCPYFGDFPLPEDKLRATRRPKPPTLKAQALLAIDTAVADDRLSADVATVVRRALEALPE